jgi:hypothetical protein
MRRRDGSVRGYALVDAIDAEVVLEYNWHLHTQGYAAAWREKGDSRNGQGRILMHRLVKEREVGRPLTDAEVVHHRGGRADNRRHKLELCASQAEHKHRERRGSVVRCAQTGRWKARLGPLWCGRHDTEEEAWTAIEEVRDGASA